ncbi:MAG: biotin transporter BioY [Ruminococcus sp.]|nr:biotin transporter BioY [Ruminococcus sp.]
MTTQAKTFDHKKTFTLCLCALFTALAAVGAFIKIPIPHLPITLQTFFTTLAGLLLGGELGAASVAVYVILGLIGVPIFTEGGGFTYVLKPSFGYLVAFIIGAYVTGKIANAKREPSLIRLLIACFAGTAVIYAVGMGYFYAAKNLWVAGDGMSVKALFAACFFPVIPGDCVKCVAAALLAKRLIPLTQRYRMLLRSEAKD